MAKVSTYYRSMGWQALMNELASVAAAMSNNRAFRGDVPEFVARAEQLLNARESIRAAAEAAATHDSIKINERNAKQAEAVALLDTVARFYELMAVGDPGVLTDIGFTPRPPQKKDALLPAPRGFSVYLGPQPETVIAEVGDLATANTWEVNFAEVTSSGTRNWGIKGVYPDNGSMVMSGFTPGAYDFRIRAFNRAGAGAWSEVVTLFIK